MQGTLLLVGELGLEFPFSQIVIAEDRVRSEAECGGGFDDLIGLFVEVENLLLVIHDVKLDRD